MKRASYPFFIIPLLAALIGGGDKQEGVLKTGSQEGIEKAQKQKPNIIFILTDDQDRESLGAMPRTRDLFPLVFKNHFLTDPVCCPSRETFMTGQYAHNHGVRSNSRQPGLIRNNQEWGGWWAARSRQKNIGLWLKRQGYRTALIGKYLNGFDSTRPIPRGWSDTFLSLDDHAKGYFNYRMLDNGQIRLFGEKAREYSSTVMTNRAIKNIYQGKKKKKPLFLFLSYNTPHNGTTSSRQPHLDPEPHPRDRGALLNQIPNVEDSPNFNHVDPEKAEYMKYAKEIGPEKTVKLQTRMRSRWQSLYSLDREIARLVRAVKKAGQEKNTYFFLTTDNGFFLGQHRLVGKFLPYEEATRFPLLVRTPKMRRGQEDALVGNIDFVPTVLDLAGARAPKGHRVDGSSLLPLIRGQATSWRQEIILETFPTVNYEVEKGPHQPYVAIRSKDDVFIRYQKNGIWPTTWNGEEEYYDLRSDPYQMNNSVSDPRYESRVKYLRRQAEKLRDCSGKSCP